MSNSAPTIGSLAVRDSGIRQLNCPVVVVGSRCAELLGAAGDQTYRRLEVGKVGGWRLAVHLYGFAGRDVGPVLAHVQHARHVVIASDGPAGDPAWVRCCDPLIRVMDAHRPDVVVALYGGTDANRYWRSSGGPPPLVHAEDGKTIYKRVVGEFLRFVSRV